jgi:hypothetical protein
MEKFNENTRIPFGKNMGTKIKDLDINYIKFLAGCGGMTKPWLWVKDNYPEFIEYSKKYIVGKCHHCGLKLVNLEEEPEPQNWLWKKYHKK